ncbi:MAG: fasciclin domain-containing protein [Verrucomicrobia bacterium]|nr:fasciclin domain-containing protein [Verrucomicrobiota bacterium]
MKTKHIRQILLLLSMAALTPATYSREVVAEKNPVVEKETVQKGSLSAMIHDSVTFSTLSKALAAAELDMTLGNKGEFTIFAPTDDAFGKLPAAVLAKLLLPENKEKLRSLLLYHVVAGKVLAAELKDGEVKTMNGEKITVAIAGETIKINNEKVFSADVAANNGVMHSIGTVLIPKSLEGFAGLGK